MERSLTTGGVLSNLLLFALPIMGANLLQAMYGTVDLMVVGRFADAAAVSAVSTGSMTMQTVTSVVTGLTMGSTVLIGRYIGMRDERDAAHTVGASLWLFIAVGALLTAVLMLLAGPLAALMNAPVEALTPTVAYLRICGAGSLFIVLFNAVSGLFRGIGDSQTPLILMAVACAVNIVGDLLFVAGLHMGAAGAACATVLAQAVSVLCAAALVRKRGFGFAVGADDLRPYRHEMVRVLQYGLPIALQNALVGVSFMIMLAILNGFGLIASAGVGVAEKLCALMFIVPETFLSAISAFSAQNVGAKEYGRARRALFGGMGIAVGLGLVMFAVSFTNGVWLAHFFAKDMEVLLAAADYLKSYSIDCVLVGVVFSMMGYLNGHGRTLFVALQGILSTFLVRIPVALLMSRIPGVTLFQIGFATPLASVFGILLTTVYFVRFERERER